MHTGKVRAPPQTAFCEGQPELLHSLFYDFSRDDTLEIHSQLLAIVQFGGVEKTEV